MKTVEPKPTARRRFMRQAGALAGSSLLGLQAWAQGSDKPEKEEVKIGFIMA